MNRNELPDLSEYEMFKKLESADIITLVFRRTGKDYVMDITGEVETEPDLGDLSIFWDNGKEYKAYVGFLEGTEFGYNYYEFKYKSNRKEWCGNAIRFRNPEQLSMIINYRQDVSKKEETGDK